MEHFLHKISNNQFTLYYEIF